MSDLPTDWTSHIPLWGAISAGAAAIIAYFGHRLNTTAAIAKLETKVDALSDIAAKASETGSENAEQIAAIDAKLGMLLERH